MFGVEEMALGNIQLKDSEVTERLFGGEKKQILLESLRFFFSVSLLHIPLQKLKL